MIGISKLYCGTVEPSDALRYGRSSNDLPSHLLQFSSDKKPVVVWNVTRACNLKCMHCYAHATEKGHEKELSTKEGFAVLDDLAEFGAPVVLFSGGEPLVRKDLVDLARYAVQRGMRAVISTNGTLITRAKAKELRNVGLSYVGVSLDGLREVHDRFRGKQGAFLEAMEGIRNCQVERYRALAGPHAAFVETEQLIAAERAADVLVADTTSVASEFVVQRKPVVTFRNRAPKPHMLDFDDPAQLPQLLARAFAPSVELRDALTAYADAIHPYRDGHSSFRVLAATHALQAGRLGPLRRKPAGAWLRSLQIRRTMHYWRP